ncbi:MAG: glycosyltransferase family 87 protein, partial [Polyangiaceae bacterium]
LVGAGFLLIDRRPLLSGALFGLAVFKPHLTLFLPVALLAARKYRVLAGMLGTVVVLVSGTALLFGADAWLAFLAKAVHAGDVATSSSSGWTRVPTLYTLARVLGAGKIIAGVVHGAVAIMAAGGVAWLWRSSARPALRNGALALALLIITPYARIYDFAFLLFPILALMSETKELAPREDRLLIALAWAAPLIGLVVRISTPWLSILLIVLLARLMVKAMREMRVTPLDASS